MVFTGVQKIRASNAKQRGRKPKIMNESLSKGDFLNRNNLISRTLEDCRNLGLFGNNKEVELVTQKKLEEIYLSHQ